jgi:hypothetical protein
MLMFGGTRDKTSDLHTPHACPGYKMAVGVMLGSVTALLQKGALAWTPDPKVVILTGLAESPHSPAAGSPAASK